MRRYKKYIFLLLSSVMLSMTIGCFANAFHTASQAEMFTSNLPIVIIDTLGRWIPDEPKIPARMRIIYDVSGGRNASNSPHINFEGEIGIEVRGKTSQSFPKLQYGFEIRDNAGNDKDVSLLQLPAESDWVLNGPFSDKTLMRNYLAYEFSNRIGRYASRTKFVEVFLNEGGGGSIGAARYIGVYLLIERIKRGKERVNIQSLKPGSPPVTGKGQQEAPSEITGGYILKIDKLDSYDTHFFTRYGTRLIHVYPKGNEISPAQKAWIRDYMNAFESALAGSDFKDPERGYAKYIDTDAFIDHFIINELFKNTDGFRNSTYMYKDRDTKLKMGPVWDFNLSMGNTIFYRGWETDNWLIDTNPVPFWWSRLLEDENFKQRLVDRWKMLRKNELSTSKLLDEIDRTAAYLSEAQKRNFRKWPVLGRHIFGNPYPGPPSYEQEIQQLKTWLQARLKWMDANIDEPQRPANSRRRSVIRNVFD